MKRKSSRDRPQNIEIKLAICKWKLYTGQTQNDLAELVGISQSQLSQIVGGFRPGTQYIERINQIVKSIAS